MSAVADPVREVVRGNVTYRINGGFVIGTDPEGVPAFVGLIPAPWVSEIEREKRVMEAREAAWLSGYFITSERRIRNAAFDRRGERTTTKIAYRTCRNPDEANFVASKINEILDRTTGQVRLDAPTDEVADPHTRKC